MWPSWGLDFPDPFWLQKSLKKASILKRVID
jgi:hypothetical protein